MKWLVVSISAATVWLFVVLSWHTLEAESFQLVPTLPLSYIDTPASDTATERYAIFPKSTSSAPKVRLLYKPPSPEDESVVVPPLVATPPTQREERTLDGTPVLTDPTPVEQTTAVAPPASAPEAEDLPVPPTTKGPFSVLIESVLDETNVARRAAGAPVLRNSAALAKAALARSTDMARRNYFGHETPDGCDLGCHTETIQFEATSWGENIAWYEPYYLLSETDLGAHFVSEWKKSSGHRRNMLNHEFTHQGVGVALDGDKIIVTVIFARQSARGE